LCVIVIVTWVLVCSNNFFADTSSHASAVVSSFLVVAGVASTNNKVYGSVDYGCKCVVDESCSEMDDNVEPSSI
jgi:hypothetical protein